MGIWKDGLIYAGIVALGLLLSQYLSDRQARARLKQGTDSTDSSGQGDQSRGQDEDHAQAQVNEPNTSMNIAPREFDPREYEDLGQEDAAEFVNHVAGVQPQYEPPRSGASSSRRATNISDRKAQSRARRDQRRAYFEYIRSVAEEQQQADREYEEQFGDIIEEERQQRLERERTAAEALAKRRQEDKERAAKQLAARQKALARLRQELASASGRPIPLTTEEDRWAARTLVSDDTFSLSNDRYLFRPTEAQWQELEEHVMRKKKITAAQMAQIVAEMVGL